MKNPPQAIDYITIGRTVVQAEADGLVFLAKQMPETFAAAAELILNTTGHLIVVGVGKSGHIGRKIAASFASTGTPAFFLHPTEAAHGDLGMIKAGCTLLAISNSGESSELRAVFAYCQKFDVPIIGITAQADSALGKTSSIVLRLPAVPEACPNGLAPTTSTTLALAIGDALAVTVMQARGFTPEDFGTYHPGGKLGLQLQTVEDWMQNTVLDVPNVQADTPAKALVTAISKGGKGCVAVLDSNGDFAGLITDGDLRRAMDDGFFGKTASQIMSQNCLTISADMKMGEVIRMFKDKRISNAFVTQDNKAVALLDLKSLLQAGYV